MLYFYASVYAASYRRKGMVIFLNSRSEKLVPEDELSRQREYALQVKKLLELRYPGRTPLAHVHTFGCQQNVSDGEKIKGMLQGMGYEFLHRPGRCRPGHIQHLCHTGKCGG